MTVSLDAALSGLKAAQRSLDVVSSNIANATTPGYTRKILPQEALVLNGVGLGVRLSAIVRSVDVSLLRDSLKQFSITQGFSVKEAYLSRIQDFHGPSDAGRSISAQIGKLADAFSDLSSAPDSSVALSKTLAAARQTVSIFNDYSTMIVNMRNETEDQISSGVTDINQALSVVADLNIRIATLSGQGRSFADLEDQRDAAIKTISQFLQVSTFKSDNNKIVVMTKQGQTLADESARRLIFNTSNILPGSYYPGGGIDGIFIDSAATGLEISTSDLGGKIGALIELRDKTLPTYQAQIDETAQKLAERFDSQGLRLFTGLDGTVPPSVAAPGIVGYSGFSGQIRVNPDIVADPSLLRSGTYGQTILSGSNEIIRKISEFAFGPSEYEQATGTADISAGTIFAALGLTQTNQLIGNVDLTDYAPDLDAAPNIAAPASFDLTIGPSTFTITINPGDTATDLVNIINAAVGSNVASLNGIGQLKFDTAADITLADNTIGAAGMADLGFAFGTTLAQNPSFEIQAGTQSPVTVTIAPGDTATDLLNTLNAISGITASLNVAGALVITPVQGGDLALRNIRGTPLTALGVTVAGVAHPAFRQNNLGPDGSLSTGLLQISTIEDYARNVITAQAQDHNLTKDRADKEEVFFQTLDKRNTDMSGVDLDEEVSELVRIQTAYSAAARMITATEQLFDDLLAAF